MRTATLALVFVSWSAAASAQGVFAGNEDAPAVSVRPYFELSRQRFVAGDTFDNVFGESSAPFWGAGAQVVFWQDRLYAEAGVSRIAREDSQLVGERVFVSSGTVYQLGIPLRSAIKPWKVAGGYRFHFSPRIIPYAGAGVTSYHYTEESDFAAPEENLDTDGTGAVIQVGVEVRAHRWVGIVAGLERTRVTGILGKGGLSQLYTSGELQEGSDGEDDLGGWALQFRIVVGR
jgi:hypothetical protein